MKFIAIVFLCCSCLAGIAQAQESVPVVSNGTTLKKAAPAPVFGKNDTIRTLAAEDVDGSRIAWIIIPDVTITDTRIFKSKEDRDNYNRLRYNVYKVIPYAHFASARYKQLERDLALTGDKKKQKELIEVCEAQIKAMFKKDIENLTISQGEILIKLIDRDTKNTSYDVVKELRGGFNAFLLQSVARIFGHNLKETYDKDEQRDIETILQQAGYDSYNN